MDDVVWEEVNGFQRARVGAYTVIGNERDWRVMESFGDYRMLKKTWRQKSPDQAVAEARRLNDRLGAK